MARQRQNKRENTVETQITLGNSDKGKKVQPKVSWDAKKKIILNDLAAGLTYREMVIKYSEDWGVSTTTAKNFIRECAAELYSDEDKEMLKSVNVLRLDECYETAMKAGDIKSAIRAVDTQNKSIGVYDKEKEDETSKDINVKFNF